MSDLQRWRGSGHLEHAIGAVGRQEAFDAAVSAMLKNARGWRLAELRQRPGITQEQVAREWASRSLTAAARWQVQPASRRVRLPE
jgi:hypothetical protein